MPSVGASDVLQKEKAWFSQEWQGDPRYLDEDRNTCGHLRMLNPVQASSAPAWDALFGANGSRLAQQFAWQLEKNVSSGGKAMLVSSNLLTKKVTRTSSGSTCFTLKKGQKIVSANVFVDDGSEKMKELSRYRKTKIPSTGTTVTNVKQLTFL